MATKTLTPSACPVTGNNAAGMPTLAPSADVCSAGGGGGTDFLVAGPIRADGNYDATVGDGSTVDSFALVGARDGNTIVKQAPADYAANAQADANWHIDGVGVADTAVFIGVSTPTIAATALEAQGAATVGFFTHNSDTNSQTTVIIRKKGTPTGYGGIRQPTISRFRTRTGTITCAALGKGRSINFLQVSQGDSFFTCSATGDIAVISADYSGSLSCMAFGTKRILLTSANSPYTVGSGAVTDYATSVSTATRLAEISR